MKLKPGIKQNLTDFSDLSVYSGATRDGEIVQLPEKKPSSPNVFGRNNRNIGNLTTLVGNTGERIAQTLFSGSKSLSSTSIYDLSMPSAYDGRDVLVEIKTAQRRNRGVIRPYQIENYKRVQDATRIYFAQIFYKMRSGRIPSRVPRSVFQREFFPLAMYVFPINFLVYLTNTVTPCGNHEATKFYALTEHRARTFYDNIEDISGESFQKAEFMTSWLSKNPYMPLYIVDHRDTPHILSCADVSRSPPSALNHPQDLLSP